MASLRKRGKRYYKFARKGDGIQEEKNLSLDTKWKEVVYDLKRKLEKMEGKKDHSEL